MARASEKVSRKGTLCGTELHVEKAPGGSLGFHEPWESSVSGLLPCTDDICSIFHQACTSFLTNKVGVGGNPNIFIVS